MKNNSPPWFRLFLCVGALALAAPVGAGQDASRRVKVTIKDGKAVAEDQALPLDPNPRIRADYQAFPYYGLLLDDKKITFNPEGILAAVMIDKQFQAGFLQRNVRGNQPKPLPPGPFGKKRLGTQMESMENNFKITRTIEIIPSKVTGAFAPGQKRHLDTVRISYLVENKDTRGHVVEYRTWVDTMIVNNDGALFASPTTHPGQILDGIELKDKNLPEYMQVLENPNLKNPGMVATMTLKFGGKIEGPNRVVLTNNLGITQGGWDIAPAKAGGDSALALYWPAKTLKPGEKREMVWAYGGGIASSPESEGRIAVTFGGSFEPGKLFTVTATVEDPAPGQMLTLELPKGMERAEGKEREPVPPPQESGVSMVMWKARVTQMGDFEIRVRSSTGVTQVKSISIQPE